MYLPRYPPAVAALGLLSVAGGSILVLVGGAWADLLEPGSPFCLQVCAGWPGLLCLPATAKLPTRLPTCPSGFMRSCCFSLHLLPCLQRCPVSLQRMERPSLASPQALTPLPAAKNHTQTTVQPPLATPLSPWLPPKSSSTLHLLSSCFLFFARLPPSSPFDLSPLSPLLLPLPLSEYTLLILSCSFELRFRLHSLFCLFLATQEKNKSSHFTYPCALALPHILAPRRHNHTIFVPPLARCDN